MSRNAKVEQLRRYQDKIDESEAYSVILLDADGTILSWNIGAEMLTGYKENEIIGQNFSIFYMPQDRQAMLPEKLLAMARRDGKATHVGQRARKDGTLFRSNIVITSIYDDNNTVIGFSKITREIKPEETKSKTTR